MMGAKNKFKAGDRVRAKETGFGLNEGVEYVVSGQATPTGDRDQYRWIMLEGIRHPTAVDGSFREAYFELVAQKASFKVGDRVIAAGRKYDTGEHEGMIVKIDSLVCVEYEGWTEGHSAGEDGPKNKWWHTVNEVRLAPAAEAPAALQIEAGKSYKTRDGKKVTSISRNGNNGGVFYWTGVAELGGYGAFWCQNGSFYETGNHPLDLVAEWVDEPVAAVIQIEAGKFYRTRDDKKVGPMALCGADMDGWSGDGGWHMYTTSGERYFSSDRGKDDEIIAEWVDEPAAASNDNEPATPKFKVGDRVRVIHTDYDHLPVGSVSTIISIDDRGVDLACDGFDEGLYFYWNEIAHTPAPNQAIVALIENGQPKPAPRPHVHASVADATAEAERLAGKHKGQTFGVYELVDQKHVAKPTYEYEWQRLAADGARFEAESIIRRLTGVTDWQARRIVSDWVRAAA